MRSINNTRNAHKTLSLALSSLLKKKKNGLNMNNLLSYIYIINKQREAEKNLIIDQFIGFQQKRNDKISI